MANTNGNDSWEKIQNGVKETERLIGQRDYNSAMMKARQTLEFMVRQHMERAGILEGGDLKDQIDLLYENNWIDKNTCEHYHKIRMIGNKAAHEGDQSPYNATQAHHMLSQEVYTFANNYSNAQKGSRVRQASKNTAPAGRKVFTGEQDMPVRNASSRVSVGGTAGQSDRSGTSRQPAGTAGRSAAASGADYQSGRSAQAGRTSQGSRGAQADRASQSGRGSAAVKPAPGSHGGASDDRAARSQNSRNAAQSARNVSTNRGRRPAPNHNQSHRRQAQRRRGFTVYDLLKLLIPVLCIVLLFLVIKLFKPGSDDAKPTKDQVTTEAVTEAPDQSTEAPEDIQETALTFRTTTTLNVRKEPSTDAERVGQLAEGTAVEYVSTYDDTWAKILYEGQTAYVSRQYLTTE